MSARPPAIVPTSTDTAYIATIRYSDLLRKIANLEKNQKDDAEDAEADADDREAPATTSSRITRSTAARNVQHPRAYGVATPTPVEHRRLSSRTTGSKQQLDRSRQRAVRRLVRSNMNSDNIGLGVAKVKAITRRVHQQALPVPTGFEPLRSSEYAYTGPKDKTGGQAADWQPDLDFMLNDLRFQLLKWDGRNPVSILDSERRILAHLAGRPDDFDDVIAELNRVFAEAERRLRFNSKQRSGRRGFYKSLSCGLSLGGGQTHPSNLLMAAYNEAIVEELLSNWAVTRLVGFTNSAFAAVHPELYTKYSSVLDSLLAANPFLRRCLDRSVFAACSINVGRVATLRHHDSLNLVTGVCSITAGGDFDYTRGGHLVLWDLKLVIQFPPGSTIMIPSALLEHSNVPIADGESRWSFTQYSAAGLFRWVDNGFRSDADLLAALKKADKDEEIKAYYERRSRLWAEGLSLLGTR